MVSVLTGNFGDSWGFLLPQQGFRCSDCSILSLFINGRVAHRSQGTKKGFGTPRTAGYIRWRRKKVLWPNTWRIWRWGRRRGRRRAWLVFPFRLNTVLEVGFQLDERNATIASVCSSIFYSFNVTQMGFISFTQGLRETGPSECKSETGSWINIVYR